MSSCGSNTYGIHRDSSQRIHISKAVTGLKCNCLCPACRQPLEARNRIFPQRKKSIYFAHTSGHACQWAGETDVHLMAKEILSEKRWMCFPSYRGKIYRKNLAKQDFDSVICEPFISGKRPDCVGVWRDENGKEIEIWIEIKVTHPVDEQKLDLIKKMGITCIEIDLKQYANLHELTEEFEQAVLKNAERVWLNAPFLDRIDKEKIEEENIARQKRNDNLRITVAKELKEKFDKEDKFEIPIPCINVCLHRDECSCIEARNCTEQGQRMVDVKRFYDLCDVLPSNKDNIVIRLQNSNSRYEPLYIAVFGEKEKFPDTVSEGKVLAVHMTSPHDTKPLFLAEDESNSSYHIGYSLYEDGYYPCVVPPSKRYYNFVEKEVKNTVGHYIQMYSFSLYQSGKWFSEYVTCEDQFDTDTKSVFREVFQFIASPSFYLHLYGIALAIEAGHVVKHCSICKYHKQYPMDMTGWCTKPEVGPKIERWSALSCAHFERNDKLIQKVKKDQPYLYKSI